MRKDEVRALLDEYGIEHWDMKEPEDLSQAMWIVKGICIDGEFDMGMRGQDHRVISCLLDDLDVYDGTKFWDAIHERLDAVRLVPESMVALVKDNSGEDFWWAVEEMGYTIEKY